MKMRLPSNINDYLDEHDEEDERGNPITVTTCECGKSWVTHYRGTFQFTSENWFLVLVTHFNSHYVK
jgi:hypothetical protein